MDLVMRLADEHGCQVAIANDPDADRLCACARDSKGKMQQLSGDELGALLGDLLLSRSIKDGGDSWVLNTIVSSRLLAALAGSYGAKHRETLTGFKWLGPAAASLDARSDSKFVFAYEEALGYMATNNVWDKDGLSALLALSDLAAELHAQGKTLIDRLEDIHRRVGLAVSTQRTIKLAPGVLGSSIMEKVRTKGNPKKIGSYDVALTLDLASGRAPSLVDEGEIPKNDVLRYYVAAGELSAKSDQEQLKLKAPRVQVRPSGTEPKVRRLLIQSILSLLAHSPYLPSQVKIYCEALGTVEEGESYDVARARVRSEIDAIADAFYEYLSESKTD